jgi:hypothetical protein
MGIHLKAKSCHKKVSWWALILTLSCACERPDGARNNAAARDGSAPSNESENLRVGAADSVRTEFESIARQLLDSTNPIVGRQNVKAIETGLANEELSLIDRIRETVILCLEQLRQGDISGAKESVDRAFALAAQDSRFIAGDLHRLKALVLLREAEVKNCILRHNKQCCIFPLRGEGIHSDQEPAVAARAAMLEYLRLQPGSLEGRWLLNIISMALGNYPEGVPESYRIPPYPHAYGGEFPRFADIAPELGVNAFNLCGGCIVDDFDGDGDLDIVTSSYDPEEPLHFYVNDGKGGFVDQSAESRLDEQLGGLNLVGADYDNDGDMDILVLRGAWLMDDGCIRNSLVRNNGDGTFTDVTYEAGMANPAYPTQTAAWADFDNDGWLDVYIGNESRVTKGDPHADYPGQLFRNNGDGTFVDIAEQAGVLNDGYCKGVAAGDYDNDGDMDIYVSNVGNNRLYRNNGDRTFTDVAEKLNMQQPIGRSFANWFFDYDNDGWLDVFVAGYRASIKDLAAEYLGKPHRATLPCLYRNRGNGSFSNEAESMGLGHVYLPMGANFGDLDFDGFVDIYLTTGEPSLEAIMPNVMLWNDGGRRFRDVSTVGGFGHLQKGHGVAFADIDNDGDADIYHQLGGFYPGDKYYNVLFENPGFGHHFLYVQLVGIDTNRMGIGARIEIKVKGDSGERVIHRAVGSVSSFGGSPARQEIGLGHATEILELSVYWPTSGKRDVLTNVAVDQFVRVTEGSADFEVLPLDPWNR